MPDLRLRQVGEWFVHGYGPRVASQAKALQERFPPLVATTIAVVFIISVLFTRQGELGGCWVNE